MIALVWEVADELYACSGEAQRMQKLYDDIMSNTGDYIECGRIILRGLKLIEKEFRKRKSAGLKHCRVMHAHDKIAGMSKSVKKALTGAGVNSSKLKDMLSMEELQANSMVYRCHQHFVKENMWNLLDVKPL